MISRIPFISFPLACTRRYICDDRLRIGEFTVFGPEKSCPRAREIPAVESGKPLGSRPRFRRDNSKKHG